MTIRFAQQADRPAIEALWELCFPDDSGFNPYYLQNLLPLGDTLLCLVDGTLAAMTQMLPYTIRLDGREVEATYIYGACTHPAFRRRHLMRTLLEESFRIDQTRGRAASMLIPQEAWLFDFYRPFGYEPAFFTADIQRKIRGVPHDRLRVLCADDIPALDRLYRAQTAEYDPVSLRTPQQWRDQIALFSALGLGAFGLTDAQGVLAASAFVWRQDDSLWVQELLARDAVASDALCAALVHVAQVETLRITRPGPGGQALGCLRRADRRPLRDPNGYFNLMLN